ncbi:MAG: coatomer gamma subunit appendage platform subdomain-containing protein [Benniella sp.]|nr:MAG: coatomer gamma subunit appendage platform subdomain-containing protein [Benniella sp.]
MSSSLAMRRNILRMTPHSHSPTLNVSLSTTSRTPSSLTPFDLSAVPKLSRQEEQESKASQEQTGTIQVLGGTSSPAQSTNASNATSARPAGSTAPSLDQQGHHADFASFEPLFKSTAKPVELTKSETEYVVTCVKHVFAHHIVFQFSIRNSVQAITIRLQLEGTEF